jgi:aerobic carbon-monoxide dehydrogenase medium subunit
MYMSSFTYHRPTSVAEVLDLLQSQEGAQILAGGHSLLPTMKLRLNAPSALVDIGRVPELTGITVEGDSLRLGAMTTHADVAASADVARLCPLLAETAKQIGDAQVRNRGTLGGSLAHADPAADYPATMVALNATIHVAGASGERTVAAADFFVDLFATALQPGELLTAVTIPALTANQGSVYLKHRHPASGYCVTGAAVVVTVDNGQCRDVRLVIGGATANPVLVTAVAEALEGQPTGEADLKAAASHVAAALADPLSDIYASADYRRHLATVLARRALALAVERAS